MNLNSFACLFFICSVCYSCNSQESEKINQNAPSAKEEIKAIDIDSFYFRLTDNRSLDFKEIRGQFVYLESNADKGKYLAKFISESIEQPIEHTRYSGDKKDILSLGSANIFVLSGPSLFSTIGRGPSEVWRSRPLYIGIFNLPHQKNAFSW